MQIHWSSNAIQKSVAPAVTPLSIDAAGVPSFLSKDGSSSTFVLPPFIKRDGISYNLARVDREENYKRVIRIKEDNKEKYSYVPAGTVAEDVGVGSTDNPYGDLMESGSAGHRTIADLLESYDEEGREWHEDEQEILDYELTAADSNINNILKKLQQHFSSPTKDKYSIMIERYFEQAIELEREAGVVTVIADTVKALKEVFKKGLSSKGDISEAETLLTTLVKEIRVGMSYSLALQHLQGLLEFKNLMLNAEEARGPEVSVMRESLLLNHSLITSGYLVHNSGARGEGDATDFTKSLAVSPILSRAIASLVVSSDGTVKKGFSCYKDRLDTDFTQLPGYTSAAAKELNEFFKHSKGVEIFLDDKELNLKDFACSKKASVEMGVLTIKDVGSTDYIRIDMNHNGRPADFSSVLRAAKSRLHLSLSMMGMFDRNVYINNLQVKELMSNLKSKDSFMTVRNNRKEKEFSITYSEKPAYNHRGELGQIFTALIHSAEDGPKREATDRNLTALLNTLKGHKGSIEEVVRGLVFGQGSTQKRGIKSVKLLSTLMPLLTSLDENENPTASDINFNYLRYFGLLEGTTTTEAEVEGARDFFNRNGFLPEVPSRFIANLQKTAFTWASNLRLGPAVEKAEVTVALKKSEAVQSLEAEMLGRLAAVYATLTDLEEETERSPARGALQELTGLIRRHRPKRKRSGSLPKREVDKLIGQLIEPLVASEPYWSKAFSEVTGKPFKAKEFFTNSLALMLKETSESNMPSAFSEGYASLLVLNSYLAANHLTGDDVTFQVVSTKRNRDDSYDATSEYGSVADPKKVFRRGLKPEEVFLSLFTGNAKGAGGNYRIRAVREGKDSSTLFTFNTKRGTGTASGMIDYGIDVAEMVTTPAGRHGDAFVVANVRTDSFEFKFPATDGSTQVKVPHVNNAAGLWRGSVGMLSNIINRVGQHVRVSRINVDRGVHMTVNTKSAAAGRKTIAYLLRENSDEDVHTTIFGEARLTPSVPLERVQGIGESLSGLPVYVYQMFFGGSTESGTPISSQVGEVASGDVESALPLTSPKLASFAQEYARQLAEEIKGSSETIYIKSVYAQMRAHPLFGDLGYDAFVEAMRQES